MDIVLLRSLTCLSLDVQLVTLGFFIRKKRRDVMSSLLHELITCYIMLLHRVKITGVSASMAL